MLTSTHSRNMDLLRRSKPSHEAKQEKAIESAQDPTSNSTSEDAERTLINDTKRAGGAAYQFNPDASPEEKAAQAASVGHDSRSCPGMFADISQHVPPGFHHERKPNAVGMVSDTVG